MFGGIFLLFCFCKLLIYIDFIIYFASDTQLKLTTDPVAAIF